MRRSGWKRTTSALLGTLAVAVVAPASAAAQGPPPDLTLFGAGSLRAAMTEVTRAFTERDGTTVRVVFGPSGSMRERIEAGERADVFTSANLGHPRTLVAKGFAREAVLFARNRLCAYARPSVGLTAENVLDRALDPAVRLGTSTPGNDPSGDYAWELFRKAEALRPGSYDALAAKALQLVGGGPNAVPIPEGRSSVAYLFETDRADMFLAYCTGAAPAAAEFPGSVVVELPETLAVGADYGLTVLKGAPVEAYRLALFILSADGQAILARYGFGAPTRPAEGAEPEG